MYRPIFYRWPFLSVLWSPQSLQAIAGVMMLAFIPYASLKKRISFHWSLDRQHLGYSHSETEATFDDWFMTASAAHVDQCSIILQW